MNRGAIWKKVYLSCSAFHSTILIEKESIPNDLANRSQPIVYLTTIPWLRRKWISIMSFLQVIPHPGLNPVSFTDFEIK